VEIFLGVAEKVSTLVETFGPFDAFQAETLAV
jgi:hypothetical protein